MKMRLRRHADYLGPAREDLGAALSRKRAGAAQFCRALARMTKLCRQLFLPLETG